MNFIGGQHTEWGEKGKEGPTGADRIPFCLELKKSSNPSTRNAFGETEAQRGDASPWGKGIITQDIVFQMPFPLPSMFFIQHHSPFHPLA